VDRAEIETYVRALGLDGAGLLGLLLARERRVGRLAALIAKDEPLEGKRTGKVTVRLPDLETKGRVVAHAREHGCGPSEAAGVLLRAELREHWLEAVLDDSIRVASAATA
jgi:hypothetical protein